MEFLSDSNEAAAADVLEFVREAIQRFDNLRMLIVEDAWSHHLLSVCQVGLKSV